MNPSIKTLLVDDHLLVLEGLKGLLSHIPNIEVVASASTGADALAQLKLKEINLAFLDISLPDINGMELCKKITSKYPHIKCIALSTFSERSYVSRMIQNGAMAYLLKSATQDEIESAIGKVMAGEFYLSPDLNHPNVASEKPAAGDKLIPVITRREKEVLQLISEGLTNPDIADKLFISVATVCSHRKSLLLKFDVSNTASLINAASRMKLL